MLLEPLFSLLNLEKIVLLRRDYLPSLSQLGGKLSQVALQHAYHLSREQLCLALRLAQGGPGLRLTATIVENRLIGLAFDLTLLDPLQLLWLCLHRTLLTLQHISLLLGVAQFQRH